MWWMQPTSTATIADIDISSVAVYGMNPRAAVDESMPTPPVGQLYPDSKIAAEAPVSVSGLPWVIVRPASTYGPRGWSVDGRPDRADQGGGGWCWPAQTRGW